jgi:hypothetical protein
MMKFEVAVEYGPTAADVHYIQVYADTTDEAIYQGKQWAAKNKLAALVCNATEMNDSEDDFTEIIEWTPEEEEEFVRLFDNTGDE